MHITVFLMFVVFVCAAVIAGNNPAQNSPGVILGTWVLAGLALVGFLVLVRRRRSQ